MRQAPAPPVMVTSGGHWELRYFDGEYYFWSMREDGSDTIVVVLTDEQARSLFEQSLPDEVLHRLKVKRALRTAMANRRARTASAG